MRSARARVLITIFRVARRSQIIPDLRKALFRTTCLSVGRGRVVDRFVAAYVAEYGRRGILGGPSRDRELAENIGREAMLAD